MFCDVLQWHFALTFNVLKRDILFIAIFLLFIAFRTKNALLRQKAQGKCEILLPEMDGRSSSESHRCHKYVTPLLTDIKIIQITYHCILLQLKHTKRVS
jgi:hypothetical protein